MRNAYNESERTAKTILSSFIDKCSRQGDDCNYKKLLENFIEDLLIACYQPEYPAAEFMLHCLAHMLVSVAPAACPPPVRCCRCPSMTWMAVRTCRGCWGRAC